MLVSDTDKLIGTQFAKLPSDVRAMLLSSDFDRNIELIRSRHDIAPEKTPALENEIFLLAIGLSDPEELVTNLSENVGVSEEEALVIIRDIDRFILTPVKNSLIKFFEGMGDESAVYQATSTPPQNLPMVEPHLEPMIMEPGTPFLPPLRKNIAVSKSPILKPTESTPQTKGVLGVSPIEVSNLLRQKMKDDLNKIASAKTIPSGPSSAPTNQANLQVKPAQKPEDKLSAVVGSKKVEISLAPQDTQKKNSDIYREPIE